MIKSALLALFPKAAALPGFEFYPIYFYEGAAFIYVALLIRALWRLTPSVQPNFSGYANFCGPATLTFEEEIQGGDQTVEERFGRLYSEEMRG